MAIVRGGSRLYRAAHRHRKSVAHIWCDKLLSKLWGKIMRQLWRTVGTTVDGGSDIGGKAKGKTVTWVASLTGLHLAKFAEEEHFYFLSLGILGRVANHIFA